jgi:hypothetical protein
MTEKRFVVFVQANRARRLPFGRLLRQVVTWKKEYILKRVDSIYYEVMFLSISKELLEF